MTPVALITGASSGIGRDLAHQFAADGYDLVLVARRRDALEDAVRDVTRTHGVNARVIAIDLATPGAARQIVDQLQTAGVTIDVLVNNAGFGLHGPVAELALERQLEMVQVNVAVLTELTRLFLPGMLERNRGGVLNVGSTAAFQPGPLMAVYYATKAYVLSFTEALAVEVNGSALRTSCLCPGPTATHFAETAQVTHSRLFRMGTMRPADVARVGYDGWKRGQVIVIPGLKNRLGAVLASVSPRSMVRRIMKEVNT